MTSFLDKIITQKQQEVAKAETIVPVDVLRQTAADLAAAKRDFAAAVKAKPVNIIAEIKRASPSKGIIDINLDAAETAKIYQGGEAAAISVLTDEMFFGGGLSDLINVRANIELPVLRKDFTISEYQIYEAAAYGADAVLLIVRILSETQLERYLEICAKLNLTALVEVYDKSDALKIQNSAAKLIGINNRNLATFDTNVNHALAIADLLRPDQTPVIASGILGQQDIKPYLQKDINTFLIGESLVRHQNTTEFLLELVNTRIN